MGAVYGDFDELALTRAAFKDIDLLPHFSSFSDMQCDAISNREKKLLAPNLLSPLLAIEKAWKKAKLSEERNELFSKRLGSGLAFCIFTRTKGRLLHFYLLTTCRVS